jgi:hypothetical protein
LAQCKNQSDFTQAALQFLHNRCTAFDKMIRKVKYGITELKNSTDQELVELIYDKVCELYFGTFGESLDKADKALSDFLAIWTLDSEVKNGGYDQFFLNKTRYNKSSRCTTQQKLD